MIHLYENSFVYLKATNLFSVDFLLVFVVLILLLEIGLAAAPVVLTSRLLFVQSAHSQSQFAAGWVWRG